jgi:MarR family transcriptional regulator, 2-MHQ and catechol-resistance regulon repressor
MIKTFTIFVIRNFEFSMEDRREAYYRERVARCSAEFPGCEASALEVAVNLLYTYDVLHQITARSLAAFGLSKSALNVLLILRQSDEPGMLLHDLGEMLLVSRANVTGLIDHLETKGWVRRVVDPQDRRARFAHLTASGRAVLNECLPVHFNNVTQLMSGLSIDERRTLVKLLRKGRESFVTNATDVPGDAARRSA